MEIQRQTAYKIWIGDLIKGKYFKSEVQFEAGYAEVKGIKINRINLIGGIIDKTLNENNISFMLDDGSGSIKLRAFVEDMKNFVDINVGDLVLVIGKVKEYNNFIYVVLEIIKTLDNPLWLKHRKLELTKEYGEIVRTEDMEIDNSNVSIVNQMVKDDDQPVIVAEKVINESPRNKTEKIFEIVERMDKGQGADFNIVVSELGEESKSVIENLIKDGELFEISKGKLRIMG